MINNVKMQEKNKEIEKTCIFAHAFILHGDAGGVAMALLHLHVNMHSR